MFLNSVLSFLQKKIYPYYQNSVILKKIDTLIFFNLLALIFFSTVLNSDTLGYFAITSILLTFFKLISKPNAKLTLTLAEKYLLLYFIFVFISLAGSTLFFLSLKGFCKTLVYL